MKRIYWIVILFIFAILCFFAWNYATAPSTKSSGGDKVPAHEEEKIRKDLIRQGLPTSQRDGREHKNQQYLLDIQRENKNGE